MRKPAGKAAARGGGAKTIDDYLAPLPAGQQRALRTLRRQIRAAAPGVTESISYGIPTFKLDGKAVAYFGAFADHLSLYGVPLDLVPRKYIASKGTIHFTVGDPLPPALVTKLVKASAARARDRAKY